MEGRGCLILGGNTVVPPRPHYNVSTGRLQHNKNGGVYDGRDFEDARSYRWHGTKNNVTGQTATHPAASAASLHTLVFLQLVYYLLYHFPIHFNPRILKGMRQSMN